MTLSRNLATALRWCIYGIVASSILPISAQEKAPIEIFAGGSYLSNSVNGTPGHRQGLPGYEVAMETTDWRHIRFQFDFSQFFGSNQNASQNATFYMGGPFYSRNLGHERIFVHALFGELGLNHNWGADKHLASTAAFTEIVGGGFDTPLSRHIALRVQGDLVHANPKELISTKNPTPLLVPGLPENYARLTAGIVYRPKLEPQSTAGKFEMPTQDIAFAVENSVGHFHIFANSWWSKFSNTAIEYDRNSWGRFLGARRDYVAEFEPVIRLNEPSLLNYWGIPRSKTRQNLYGVGVFPVGMQLLWNDGGRIEPYYSIKAGAVGFTQKALSVDGSYVNFSLQQTVGLRLWPTPRIGMRVGFSVYHFSDAFVVPSNPGLDSMMVQAAVVYRWKVRPGK